MLENEVWQSRAGRLFCLSVTLAGVYIILKYALGVLLPFLFALIIGGAISSLARKSSSKLGGKRKSWAVFYVVVLWSGIFMLIYLATQRLASEAGELIGFLGERSEEIGESIEKTVDFIMEIPSRIPLLRSLDGVGELAADTVGEALKWIVQILTEAVGKAVIGAPAAALAITVCIIASAYIAVDGERIREYLLGLLSNRAQRRTRTIFFRIVRGLRGYARAYFWLFLINFSQIYAGLLILRRRYAFVISLAAALLDMLPLFSAGVILIPWGIILIVGGDYFAGVGMLVVFGIFVVVRQIAEPRLIGKELGVHPLATLASMYIGLGLFGFWGMILAPIGILMIKEILESSKKEEKIGEKT